MNTDPSRELISALVNTPENIFPVKVEEISSEVIYDYFCSVSHTNQKLRLPPYQGSGEDLEDFLENTIKESWLCVVKAALDRNMVVLDSDAKTGEFTKRLVSLVKTVQHRSSSSLCKLNTNTIFMDDDGWDKFVGRDQSAHLRAELAYPFVHSFGVTIRPLELLNETLLKYYLKELGGTLPSGDNNLAVAVADSVNNSRAMCVWPNTLQHVSDGLKMDIGIGVFNIESVLLASY